MSTHTSIAAAHPLSRRELLRGALQLGAVSSGALALAACGDSGAALATGNASPSPAPNPAPTPSPTPEAPLPTGNYRVDVHTHHIPDFYRVSLLAAGKATAGGIPLPQWTPERHLGFMNSYGIEMAVLSISEPGVTHLPTAAERLAMSQQINDYTAQLIAGQDPLTNQPNASYTGRFGGFACLPLGNPQDPADLVNSIGEVNRALTTLSMDGVGLLTHYNGVYLGDPAYAPLLAQLDAMNAVVFLHPVTPSAYPDLKLPTFLYEFTFDTTRAVVNMLYRQVFKTYPNIRWILSHAGGCLPFLSYRTSLLLLAAGVDQNLNSLPGTPLADVLPDANTTPINADPAFATFYYDTALSPVPAAMKSVREVAPLSHTLFATDWPFSEFVFPAAGSPVPLSTTFDPAPQLSQTFTNAERIAVERDNARALFTRF